MAGSRCRQTFEVDNVRQLSGQIESSSCSEVSRIFSSIINCKHISVSVYTLTKTCRMGRCGLRPRSISYTRKVKTKQLNSHTSCHVAGATYLNDAVWELNVSHSCGCKRTFKLTTRILLVCLLEYFPPTAQQIGSRDLSHDTRPPRGL